MPCKMSTYKVVNYISFCLHTSDSDQPILNNKLTSTVLKTHNYRVHENYYVSNKFKK